MATIISRETTPIVRRLFSSSKIGVVVSAGKMQRAVKVRIAEQEWNKKFKKHFPSPVTHLVADPNNSLVEGDVVRIASGWRTSKHIRHVVTAIVSPFGRPVEERPPVLTEEERMELRIRQRLLKDVRSAAKNRIASAQRLKLARKLGYKIPTLEEAMANVKLSAEGEQAQKMSPKATRAEKHAGQAVQVVTSKERRKEQGTGTKAEKNAAEKVKEVRAQKA